jgi:hypothetical protein
LEELGHFYSELSRHQSQQQVNESTLLWFGDALRDAKELRNNNNYEALLIAHEYDHFMMSDAFQKLAEGMKGLALKTLERFRDWLAWYLETSTGEPWDCAAEDKIGFARPFLEDRVLEATKAWYGQGTGDLIAHFIEPITALPEPKDRASAEQMRCDVNFKMFSPKGQLMRGFQQRVANLRSLAHRAPEASVRPSSGIR